MSQAADASTNPSLLRKIADWRNHCAWVAFMDRYEPLLRRCCAGCGLDGDSADEVCQRIWIELAERMKTFQYDPGRSFRGWLRRLCESRIIDFLRLGVHRGLPDEFALSDQGCQAADTPDEESDAAEEAAKTLRELMLGRAQTVQAVVKAKVAERTWDAYWLVSVADWTVERTATALGTTKIAVYAARERVTRMLREEGERLSDEWRAVS